MGNGFQYFVCSARHLNVINKFLLATDKTHRLSCCLSLVKKQRIKKASIFSIYKEISILELLFSSRSMVRLITDDPCNLIGSYWCDVFTKSERWKTKWRCKTYLHNKTIDFFHVRCFIRNQQSLHGINFGRGKMADLSLKL